jgi:hypothetical protein
MPHKLPFRLIPVSYDPFHSHPDMARLIERLVPHGHVDGTVHLTPVDRDVFAANALQRRAGDA